MAEKPLPTSCQYRNILSVLSVLHTPKMSFFNTYISIPSVYLVHAKFKPTSPERGIRGTVKCGDRRCTVCNFLRIDNSFKSKSTGKTDSITYALDCNSRNVIYLLSCKTCGIQYVGSTSTKFCPVG